MLLPGAADRGSRGASKVLSPYAPPMPSPDPTYLRDPNAVSGTDLRHHATIRSGFRAESSRSYPLPRLLRSPNAQGGTRPTSRAYATGGSSDSTSLRSAARVRRRGYSSPPYYLPRLVLTLPTALRPCYAMSGTSLLAYARPVLNCELSFYALAVRCPVLRRYAATRRGRYYSS
eukprot:2132289-Rhodomonas_salina.4